MIFLLALLLPHFARGQLPPFGFIDLTPPAMPPTPGPPCISPEHCAGLARPCEVRSCQLDRCNAVGLRSPTQTCIGLKYSLLKDCMCDGESAECPNCDSSPPLGGVLVPADTQPGSNTDKTPPANTPGAGVPVVSGMVNPAVTTTTGMKIDSDASGTSDIDGPVEEGSPGTRRSEGGITESDTPPTTTPRKTKTMADDVQQDGDAPFIPIIAGSVVGCVALLGLIAAAVYFVSRRSRQSTPSTPHTIQSVPSPSSSSSSIMTLGTSEYGAAPSFPPSSEYGVAPPLAQSYDAPPPQMFANYESVRDPLQL
jgi:hypothetical protein